MGGCVAFCVAQCALSIFASSIANVCLCVWLAVCGAVRLCARCAAQRVCVYMWLFVKLRYDDPDNAFQQSCQKHASLTDLVLASVILDPPSLTMSKSTSVFFISVYVTFRPNFSHCLSQPLALIVSFSVVLFFSPSYLPLFGVNPEFSHPSFSPLCD